MDIQEEEKKAYAAGYSWGGIAARAGFSLSHILSRTPHLLSIQPFLAGAKDAYERIKPVPLTNSKSVQNVHWLSASDLAERALFRILNITKNDEKWFFHIHILKSCVDYNIQDDEKVLFSMSRNEDRDVDMQEAKHDLPIDNAWIRVIPLEKGKVYHDLTIEEIPLAMKLALYGSHQPSPPLDPFFDEETTPEEAFTKSSKQNLKART